MHALVRCPSTRRALPHPLPLASPGRISFAEIVAPNQSATRLDPLD
ncbi:MAG: hypothetical protein R3E53_05190 [Myxococcota bacterium]